MLSLGQAKSIFTLARNLIAAALLYACIFAVIHSIRNEHTVAQRQHAVVDFPQDDPQPLNLTQSEVEIVGNTSAGLKVKFAGMPQPVIINPHANSFNRPNSVVVPQDDYMGRRPNVDVEAFFPKLLDACRGSYEKAERIRRIAYCLNFLYKNQGDYSRLLPKNRRASRLDPRLSGFANSDGHNNTRSSYPEQEDAEEASLKSPGVCAGPIVPYHVYWYGPVSWRLELFIKSYLYTQNLPCSRLHVWFDGSDMPLYVNKTITNSKAFARFAPLIDRGDLVLQKWSPPSRILLLATDDNTDGLGYSQRPSLIDESGEVDIGHGLVMDRHGQQWLTLSQKQLSFLPRYPLDFVRLVVLHQHGGVFLNPDVLLLRDLRPLVIPQNHSFAMRYESRAPMGEYSSSVMSMKANSSISSYLLRGGIRMGMNFHSLVLGMMARKDGRHTELEMIENSFFNPLWPGNRMEGPCPVPCHRGDASLVFQGRNGSVSGEWQDFGAKTVKVKEPKKSQPKPDSSEDEEGDEKQSSPRHEGTPQHLSSDDSNPMAIVGQQIGGLVRTLSGKQRAFRALEARRRRKRAVLPPTDVDGLYETADTQLQQASSLIEEETFTPLTSEEEILEDMGIIKGYDARQDDFPPTNRTLQNFYRGAYAYQIHGQWHTHPAPNSWIDVIRHAHDDFFAGRRTNMYGEHWKGPRIDRYNRWPEFL